MRSMNLGAIYHQPWLEYRHALPDGRVCIRIRTGRGDWDQAELWAAEMYGPGPSMKRAQKLPMERMWRDENHDWFECVFMPPDPRIHYAFCLIQEGFSLLVDQDGMYPASLRQPEDMVSFPFPFAYPEPKKPDWAIGAVGYQIFPDRFRRAPATEAAAQAVEPWNSTRYANEFRFGGNLKGIMQAIPYLKELGVGMVYMTPIFLSNTSHRYNIFDYYMVDPLLGTLKELRALSDELHASGIRIVLDGVFNHSGTQFAPFMDAKEKGPDSEYYDWFTFDKTKYDCGYATFAHTPDMPKLNLHNESAAAYFIQVGRYWLRQAHVDGWRLDVSPEVWPDFWRQFRKEMLDENPEAILVAECWDDSRQWVTQGDMFDSTMHYVLSRAMWLYFAQRKISLQSFDAQVNRAMSLYPHTIQEVLWNFLGSHDTPRFLTRAGGDENRLRAAAFFQMTHPGVPIVYYGDELGLSGGPDPDCRKPMPWDKTEGNTLLAYYKQLIHLRNSSEALRRGSFKTWHTGLGGLYAYLRTSEKQEALVAFNTSDTALDITLPLPEGFAAREEWLDHVSGVMLPNLAGTVRTKLTPSQGLVILREV
jgi:glycosidase